MKSKNRIKDLNFFTKFYPMSKFTKVSNILSSCCLGLVLTLLDVLSYGRNILGKEGGGELENISIAIYSYTTALSQIFFNIFTGIKSGVMAGFICENAPLCSRLFQDCVKLSNGDHEVAHTNFLVCRILSVLLFAALSLFLDFFKIGSYIQNIPEPAIAGCLGLIGVSQVLVGYSEVNYSVHKSIIFIVLSVLLAISLYMITEKLLQSSFSLPLSCALFTIAFYLIAVCVHGKSVINNLRDKSWIGGYDNTIIFPNQLYKFVNIRKISMKIILKCSLKIISLATFSMIHITINLPSFSSKTKVPYDFSRELKTQSYSNVISSIFGGYGYFIASYSVLFTKSGGTKLSGVILGICLPIIPICGPMLKGFVPIIVLSALPTLMGIYFLIPILYSFFECTIFEYSIIVITLAASFFTDLPLVGLLSGTFCCFFLHFLFSMKKPKNVKLDINAPVFRFNTSLTFLNINSLIDSIKNNTQDIIVIDLLHCSYIDWNARNKIVSIINDSETNIILIGRPRSFLNYNELQNKKLYKAKDYEDAKKHFASIRV
ncbi:Sulfate transporter family protein [Spraguea lophii 42_110]|uniref:Sulfate transporter family protein n=1 Tax=Spraguea lophii (strain 42_110) TaxID=1358809 RepID=S7W5A6_SPRLO|nr:Sulfate transporter family protein [Spraguea lophii 42_110]